MSIIQVDTLQKRDGSTFPLGKIGQVIYGTFSTTTNTSSTSYVDTGLNANITPSATSSKVLVMAKIHGMWNNAGAGRAMLFKILRAVSYTHLTLPTKRIV